MCGKHRPSDSISKISDYRPVLSTEEIAKLASATTFSEDSHPNTYVYTGVIESKFSGLQLGKVLVDCFPQRLRIIDPLSAFIDHPATLKVHHSGFTDVKSS